MKEDNELRELFRAQRAAELRGRPSVDEALLGRKRSRAWVLAPVLAAAAALAIGVSLWRAEPPTPQVSIAAWRSPTAFLLRTPGVTSPATLTGDWNEEVLSCPSCF